MKASKVILALGLTSALALPAVSFAQEDATGAAGLSATTLGIGGAVAVAAAAAIGFASSGNGNGTTATGGTTGTTGTTGTM